MNRPISKILEHIDDTLWHLEQSDLPKETKIELDGLLRHAKVMIAQAVKPTSIDMVAIAKSALGIRP